MNIPVFLFVTALLQVICLYIGSRGTTPLKNQSDYFLAGRNLGLFPLMMTCVATQVGGGLVLGAADEAYQYGLYVLLYPLGAALGLIILGLGIGKRLYNLNVSTVADIFVTRYKSPRLKTIASLLSIASLFMILVAQFIASAKFMASFGVDSRWIFLAFWSVVIIYTTMGGLKAVVDTDVVQALFFSTVFFCTFAWVIGTNPTHLNFMLELGAAETIFLSSGSKIFGWLLMPLAFMLFEQDIAQRCFAGESSKVVSKATFLAGVLTLTICCIPAFLGVMARVQGLEIAAGQSVLMTTIEHLTNPYITALIAAAIFGAIISTADSLINAISSNISQDFKLPFIKTDEVKASRLVTVVISASGLIFSFYFKSIVNLLIQSYELSVSCIFVPIFFVLFTKRDNALSAGLAIAFGGASFILLRLFPLDFPREAISIALSFTGFGIGEWITGLLRPSEVTN